MGNTITEKRLALFKKIWDGKPIDSTKSYNIEDVTKDQTCRIFYEKFAKQLERYVNLDDLKLDQVFDDFELQTNENDETNKKRSLVKELNEFYTAGVSTPDYLIEDLKETSKFYLEIWILRNLWIELGFWIFKVNQ